MEIVNHNSRFHSHPLADSMRKHTSNADLQLHRFTDNHIKRLHNEDYDLDGESETHLIENI